MQYSPRLSFFNLPFRAMQTRFTTLLLTLLLLPAGAAAQNTIYVDTDAAGANDGTSWSDAYTSLHDALANPATTGASASNTEIWIAEGAYTPADDPDINETNEDTSFVVTGNQDSLEVYGGFASGDTFADRNPEDHPVVLSGDIEGNDSDKTAAGVTPTAEDIDGSNSNHVLILNGGIAIGSESQANITTATVIDGIVITGGNASSTSPDNRGGGIYCDGTGSNGKCNPTISNVSFTGNSAGQGGAIYGDGNSNYTIKDVAFTSNRADISSGGAILNSSSPTITDARFIDNSAEENGGAINNSPRSGETGSPTITDATFLRNSAGAFGGAIYNVGQNGGVSNPTITNAVFTDNEAYQGGAIYNFGNGQSFSGQQGTSSPTIRNSIFISNSADDGSESNNGLGGAIYNLALDGGVSSPTITNSSFTGNSADDGGAIHNVGTSNSTITNAILWGNSASNNGDEVFNDNATPTISHSIIEGSGGSGSNWDSVLGTDDGGNLDANPQFADADGPDDSLGTEDDDLRLQGPGSSGGASPAIDAGDNEAVSASEDLAGNARKQDIEGVDDTGNGSAPIVDMGAYESSGAPLPVELAGFDARVDDGAVQLSWQTASETNNAGFRVQRRVADASTPGVHKRARERGSGSPWTTVGSVEGSGTTSQAQSYRFTDADLPYQADVLTYRLKQVDIDGTAHLSKTVTVERGVQELELLGTYPNPAQSRATVRYALPEKQDATIRLYDVLGRRVRTVVSGEQEGRHEQHLDTSRLSSGVYFLRLEAGGQTRTQKLTVIR